MKHALTPMLHALTRALTFLFVGFLLISLLPLLVESASAAGIPAIPWIAFNGGGASTGVNTAERSIGLQTVQRLKHLWTTKVPSLADGAPAVLPHVRTPSGIHDLLFYTTLNGTLLAVDANSGAVVWRHSTGSASPHVDLYSGPPFTPSSPAIDPYSYRYVYSAGIDGKVHQYDVATRAETLQKWPVTVTFYPQIDKISSSLNIFNGYLYVETASYNDEGHYVGHVVAINLATVTVHVFNTLCANKQQLLVTNPKATNYCPQEGGGVWGRAGVVGDAVTNSIFFTVGNGDFNADKRGHDYGETILRMTPDASRIIDSYTPSSYDFLNHKDLDLGSAAPLLLPRQNHSSTPYLLAQASKNGELRLLNRLNLSGRGGPNHVGGELQVVQLPHYRPCLTLTHPIAWNDSANTTWVFVADDCGLYAYQLHTDKRGHTQFQLAYKKESPTLPDYGYGGTSPFMANGVLYVQNTKTINAMDPKTGRILWSSAQKGVGGTLNGRHWETPVVVNSRIYTADTTGHLYAFGV